MIIKADASPKELSSPFYKMNEEFCAEFENYIASKGGNVIGSYNAYSYNISGKLNKPRVWILEYKKSTFSSGNLLLSSKYQNLLTIAKWRTKRTDKHNSEFLIRKKKLGDIFKLKFSNSIFPHSLSEKYVVVTKNNHNKLIRILNEKLSPLFENEEVYEIELGKSELRIELRTDNHYFDYFHKISGQ